MPSQTRIGIIGCGAIANAHCAAIRQLPQAQLVAVADVDLARANALAARYDVPSAYPSAAQLLAQEPIDIVIIATWPDSHAHFLQLAADAGVRGVLVEKPMGRSLPEVEAMVTVANTADIILIEGLMYRHHPQIALARRLVLDGVIGEPVLLRASFNGINNDPKNWRTQPAAGGGVIGDRGCYLVDSARYLLGGEPTRVEADVTISPRFGVIDQMVAILSFGDEKRAIFDASFLVHDEQSLTISGTRGRITLPRPYIVSGYESSVIVTSPAAGHPLGEGDTRVEHLPPVNPYALELANMCEVLTTGSPPLVTTADSIAVQRTLDAIAQSKGSRPTTEVMSQ
jgi:xylose dehydrogenase (NAD/NADP)